MKIAHTQNLIVATFVGALAFTATTLVAQDAAGDDEKVKAAELAKKLSNPVAALISVPFQRRDGRRRHRSRLAGVGEGDAPPLLP